MAGLLDVVRVSLSGDRPRTMLPKVLSILLRQSQASRGAIFLLDLKTGCFELACDPTGIDMTSYEPVCVANQISVALDPDVELITNVPNSPLNLCCTSRATSSFPPPEPYGHDWSAIGVGRDDRALLIPITRAETCLGMVLLVGDRLPRARDRGLYASVQAISGIYDLRSQYRLLGESQMPLDLEQTTGDFFASVMDLLVKSSGMEFIALRQLEPDGTLTTLAAQQIVASESSIVADGAVAAHFAEAIQTREAVAIDSVPLEGLLEEIVGFAPDVRSFVAAPVVLGRSRESPDLELAATGEGASDMSGRVFGTLSLASRVEYQFSSLERLGFMLLANGVGLAIENYRNVMDMSVLREKQVEAGAALQAQEMAQGFRHEIRKKLDNITGIFATDASRDEIEVSVERQSLAISAVLNEWKSYAAGFDYRWEWCSVRELWSEALEHAEFQLGQVAVRPKPRSISSRVEIYCSRAHFVRFVLDGLILNSVDAFRERSSRTGRAIDLNTVGRRGPSYVLRYHDTAGGIRSERVRSQMKRRAEWSDLPASQVIFQPGFSTKTDSTRGVGGGYGLHLARQTMSQLEGTLEVVSAGEPGAVFEISIPLHRVRGYQ